MSNQSRPSRTLLAAAGAALALCASPLTAGPAYRVSTGSVTVMLPMTVGGSFEAKTTVVEGEVVAQDGGKLDGRFTVDLASLDTGIELRNRHMRENYLEVQKGEGFDKAVLTGIRLEAADAAAARGKVPFTGTFLVHGQEQPVSGVAEVKDAGGNLQVEATFPVRIPDHGIEKPRYLGVGVKDEVKVKVVLTLLAPGPAERS